jgi:hypothetical protein
MSHSTKSSSQETTATQADFAGRASHDEVLAMEVALEKAWQQEVQRHKAFVEYSARAAASIVIGGQVAFNAEAK